MTGQFSCDFTEGVFSGKLYSNLHFKDLLIVKGLFGSVTFENCLFTDVVFRETDFSGAAFDGCIFDGCTFSSTHPDSGFRNCIIKGFDMYWEEDAAFVARMNPVVNQETSPN